jgi:hypothetical protein
MKTLKLDCRFSHFPEYKYALQFTGVTTWQKRMCAERQKCAQIFANIYGPSVIMNPDKKASYHHCVINNPLWMNDPAKNRIYYQDPSVLSMILLRLSAV